MRTVTRPAEWARKLTLAIAALGLVLATVIIPTNDDSASAAFGSSCLEDGNSGTNLAPCFADDANMDFCTVYAWDTTYGNVFMQRMAYLDSATDMYDTYTATCGSQTDIGGWLNMSKEIDLRGTSTYGAALCTKPLGGWGKEKCDQGSLVMNTGATGSGSQFAKTMCHEIGHFTGLWHFSAPVPNSCMVSGASTLTYYNTTERGNINDRY